MKRIALALGLVLALALASASASTASRCRRRAWCPLGSHASLGMKTTLTLRGPVAGPTPTNPNPPGYGGGSGY